MRLISLSKTWNVYCQRSTSWRLLFTQSSVSSLTRKTTCALLRTSSKWSEPPLQNVIRSLVVSAWLAVSSFSSSSMMSWSTSNLSDHTSSMRRTSTGTMVLLVRQLVNIRKLKKGSCRSKMSAIRPTTATFHGSVAATLWTRSLTLLGISTSIWRPQTRVYHSSILLQMTATGWASSTSPWRHSMSWSASMPTLNSGKVSVELQSVSSSSS